MRLTVAIPTYNRNATLLSTLKHLLPQLTDDCQLLILDNHSDVVVEQSLRDFLAEYPHAKCRIIRNATNVGASANILRCIEYCETEWMWLLGDDDQPADNAIATILKTISERSDCMLLHFTSPNYSRQNSKVATGLGEFVSHLGNWSHFNFMSVWVCKCEAVRPFLRYGYHFAYSLSPHVSVFLAAFTDVSSCYLANESIIAHQSPAEWPAVQALLGKATLLDLPMDEVVRREFARVLQGKSVNLEAMALLLVQLAHAAGNGRLAIYQYDQICSRVYYYDRSWFTRLRIWCYRLLVQFHAIGHPLLKTTFPALKRLTGYHRAEFATSTPSTMFHRL